jgi:hypothetical protein
MGPRILFLLTLTAAVLALTGSLAVAAVVYLLRGLSTALIPLTGPAGAYALAGLACLLVLLSLAWLWMVVLTRSRRRVTGAGKNEPGLDPELARELVRHYPWEAAGAALLAGLTMENRQLRKLLIESGQWYLDTAQPGRAERNSDG